MIRQEVMNLLPLERPGSSQEIVKLDDKSITQYVDDSSGDNRVRFNFDVNEFEAETVCVKAVGNTIEVKAKRKSIKGDEEKSEEYSRTYEMPTKQEIQPATVTSSFYKDGVLTVELPADAPK
nr:small heat shock protein [Flabelliderma ockeri]